MMQALEGNARSLGSVEPGVGPCPLCARDRSLLTVNTVDFDVLDDRRLVEAVGRFRRCGRAHAIHFLAAHPTVVARGDPAYRRLLNASDLNVSDGTPIAAILRLRHRSARRITSTDGFVRLCREGAANGWRHYFVGGASDAVARAVRAVVERDFPGLTIAGFEVPPFRPYDNAELQALAARIRASRADVVWVGIGAPKQDILAHRLREESAAPAIVCIGATFDFVAGTKRRAPRWLRGLGLEWLFRLILEPRRLWRRYLIGNVQFLAGVVSDLARRR